MKRQFLANVYHKTTRITRRNFWPILFYFHHIWCLYYNPNKETHQNISQPTSRWITHPPNPKKKNHPQNCHCILKISILTFSPPDSRYHHKLPMDLLSVRLSVYRAGIRFMVIFAFLNVNTRDLKCFWWCQINFLKHHLEWWDLMARDSEESSSKCESHHKF